MLKAARAQFTERCHVLFLLTFGAGATVAVAQLTPETRADEGNAYGRCCADVRRTRVELCVEINITELT